MNASMNQNLSRRRFLKIGTASTLALSISPALIGSIRGFEKPVKIGLIADLHQDIMHDGKERLSAFLQAMEGFKPNAILQLGDFAYPGDKNKIVIDMFNQAHQNSWHVIGNHDTDAGYTKQQCIDYWGMPDRYYTQKLGGVTFIVLDGNDKGSPTHGGGYASYIGEAQWIWLQKQLEETEGPIIIVSHQPLAGAWAVDNAEQIQEILGKASDKILLAINGHSHVDSLVRIRNVSYLHINSASYLWAGDDYKHLSYPAEIHEKFPWIEYTCPYKDSLFATMTIDPANLTIKIEGQKSQWVGKPPTELGFDPHPELTIGEEIAPGISNRSVEKVKSAKK